VVKIIKCVIEVKLNVHIDQTKRFAGVAESFLHLISPKLAQVTFFLTRLDAESKSQLGGDPWSDDIWQGNGLSELRSLYPRMRLSSEFGGSDEHLLKLLTANESLLQSICLLTEIGASSTETFSTSTEFFNSSSSGSSEHKSTTGDFVCQKELERIPD